MSDTNIDSTRKSKQDGKSSRKRSPEPKHRADGPIIVGTRAVTSLTKAVGHAFAGAAAFVAACAALAVAVTPLLPYLPFS